MARLSGQRGMSLVEATIILLVLMMLTSVLAPSIWDYVNDARDVKVKEDCEAIGTSIVRLLRDVPCIAMKPSDGCTVDNRADMLVSDAPPPVYSGAATVSFNSNYVVRAVGWPTNPFDASSNSSPNVDYLHNHLVTNSPGGSNTYDWPGQNYFRMPISKFGYGWRGAYISSPVNGDPWGHRYQVNTVFLSAYGCHWGSGCGTPTEEGYRGWTYDTFCISAGRDGVMETAFYDAAHHGTPRAGDDFTFTIAGGSR